MNLEKYSVLVVGAGRIAGGFENYSDTEIKLTHVHDTGLLLTDSGGTPTLQFHDANESISSDGGHLIFTSNGVAFDWPSADGSDGQQLTTDGNGVLTWAAAGSGGGSTAADDIGAGDDAVSIATTSGNITIDAQEGNSDIIFKGTDGSSDITFMTMDGSESSILIPAAQQLQFRDTGLHISSNADGDLDIVSATSYEHTIKHK